jgi:hypothetical protein
MTEQQPEQSQPQQSQPLEKKDYAAIVAELAPDLHYEAIFIPQSASRNAKRGKQDRTPPSLNWVCVLTNSRGGSFRCDYTQGIAHMPGYKQTFGHKTLHQEEQERCAAETGHCLNEGGRLPGREIPPPLLHDVLSSLLMEAEAMDADSFEDWAVDMDYDPDSRKAEGIYDACVKVGLALRRLLGNPTMVALREALAGL